MGFDSRMIHNVERPSVPPLSLRVAMRWQPARSPDKVLFGLVLLFAMLDVVSMSHWATFQVYVKFSVYWFPCCLILAHAVLYSVRYRASLQWFLATVLIWTVVMAMNFMWLLKASADV